MCGDPVDEYGYDKDAKHIGMIKAYGVFGYLINLSGIII
jgi:hypothetical protein